MEENSVKDILNKKYIDSSERDLILEKYVRVKLGQKLFPTPEVKDCENPGEFIFCKNNCDNCKYNNWYYNEWKKNGHLRINFDADDDIINNKNLIELFNKDFVNKKVIIFTHEGCCFAYIVSKSNYNKYNYWNEYSNYDDINLPYEKQIDFSSESTVKIILELIKYCNHIK